MRRLSDAAVDQLAPWMRGRPLEHTPVVLRWAAAARESKPAIALAVACASPVQDITPERPVGAIDAAPIERRRDASYGDDDYDDDDDRDDNNKDSDEDETVVAALPTSPIKPPKLEPRVVVARTLPMVSDVGAQLAGERHASRRAVDTVTMTLSSATQAAAAVEQWQRFDSSQYLASWRTPEAALLAAAPPFVPTPMNGAELPAEPSSWPGSAGLHALHPVAVWAASSGVPLAQPTGSWSRGATAEHVLRDALCVLDSVRRGAASLSPGSFAVRVDGDDVVVSESALRAVAQSVSMPSAVPWVATSATAPPAAQPLAASSMPQAVVVSWPTAATEESASQGMGPGTL